MAPSTLDRERYLGRGPLGLGVNAFLPRENTAVLARPNFYEPRRPTTTEFEKASDILVKPVREQWLLRQAWRATTPDAQRQALDTALANLGLSAGEIASEQKEARGKLTAASGRIYTTATWAVESICTRFNSGDRSVTNSGQEASLRSACTPLSNYFNIRNSRVKSTVAAEIIQVGARSERGNQNTCSASNGNIATLPTPPYSDNQYNSALGLYLRSTLAAGKFPAIDDSLCPRYFRSRRTLRSALFQSQQALTIRSHLRWDTLRVVAMAIAHLAMVRDRVSIISGGTIGSVTVRHPNLRLVDRTNRTNLL